MSDNAQDVKANLAAWIVARSQSVQTTLSERIYDDTPVKTGYTQSQWTTTETINAVGDVGRYENAAPAAIWLEMGRSDQAPYGMARVNVAKIASEGAA